MNNFNKAKEILVEHNIKITPQRIAVYNALSELGHGCAEEIIEKVHEHSPTITIATIYNVLDCFVKSNIISMVNTPQNRMYFDIINHDHHHLLSIETQQVMDYHDAVLDKMIEDYLSHVHIPNFDVKSVSIQLKGNFISDSNK